MRDIEGLARIRADVSPPSAEAWASARSAVLNAFINERGLRQMDGHVSSVIALPNTGRRSCDTRRIVAAAVIAIVAAGGAVALGVEHARSSGGHDANTLGRGSSVPLSGTALRLAGYRFKLPAGFKTVTTPCAPTPRSTPGPPITVLGGFSAAASADGGCVQAALVDGPTYGPPALAQSVQLGSYQGFLSMQSSESETLYVTIPAKDGNHYLVLSAIGLSSAQLVAIVTAGLPAPAGQTGNCAQGCG